ncbi:MAG: hypothetical protein QXJ59_04440 [Thermofilaceae archaeon]
MKVRYYLNGYLIREGEEDSTERILIEIVEDYDANGNYNFRAKIGVSPEEEIDEAEVFEKIEEAVFNEDEVEEEWEMLRAIFNIFYEYFGMDPSYEFHSKYIGGDFPRRKITIKFY